MNTTVRKPEAMHAETDRDRRAIPRGLHRLTAGLLALCVILAALVAIAPSAFAEKTYENAPFGTGYGFRPWSLAINQSTGHVYVTDVSNPTVSNHLASGALDGANPLLTGVSFVSPRGVAVDNSAQLTNGDIYVADDGTSTVYQFDSSGAATATEITVANLPPAGTAQSGGLANVVNGGFVPSAVAVNSQGNIFVTDNTNHAIDEFNSSGIFIAQIGAGKIGQFTQIAIDSTDNLYVPAESGGAIHGVIEFNAAGACVNSCTPFDLEGNQLSVAVDSNGNVYVPNGVQVFKYNAAHSLTETFGFGTFFFATSLGVSNTTGLVYLADFNGGRVDRYKKLVIPDVTTQPATEVEAATATLNGHVSLDSADGGGEITECRFEWGESGTYGHTALCETTPPSSLPYSADTDVHANIASLNFATSYHYRVVASNSDGSKAGNDVTFTTNPIKPAVVSEAVTEVHSESALLKAQINPNGGDTSYQFEYGLTATYGESTQPASIGAGKSAVSVSVPVTGLSPGTTYHVRVVASNPIDTEVGPDITFTTYPFVAVLNDTCPNALARQQTSASLVLDCRAYELVSASNSGGYDVESSLVPGQTPYSGYPQASGASGSSRVLYGVHDGALPGVSGYPTNKGVDPYVATRGVEGWTTSYVGIPANDPFASEPFSSVPTAADSGLETFAFGGEGGCSPCFEEGYTGIPVRLPNGGVVQGMVAAGNVTLQPGSAAKPDGYVATALSSNGEHLIFGSTTQFAEGGNDSTGDVSLYDRDLKTEETHVVSNTPGGVPLACEQGVHSCHSPTDGNGIGELDISRDGSRIIVAQKVSTDPDGNLYWHLYMDINDSVHTVDLTPGASQGVLYDGMSEDGSKVFFTSIDQLAGGNDSDNSADLYEAEVSQVGAVTLSRISTGEGTGNTNLCDPNSNSAGPHWNTVGGTENCGVVAVAAGGGVAAGDGSIYFLSPEQLQDGHGTPNQPNLYVARPGEAPRFVATLSPSDPLVIDSVKETAVRETGDFQVSPSGDFAVFATASPLQAGFDNSGFSEVYRYDAPASRLDCPSCNPTNAEAQSNATLASSGSSLANDGRVFFNSDDQLVLRDTDNRKDVYEWEPNGSGNCQPDSPNYFGTKDDCLGLISAGSGSFNSSLLGISADGADAFFFTHDTLALQDHNGPVAKIYDARTEGGFFKVPSPPPCAASDECHGPGSAAPGPAAIKTEAGTPANATEVVKKKCKKGSIRRHGKCRKKPQHRKGHRP